MTLACQRDSYLKTLETKVVSCTSDERDGDKKNFAQHYIIILEDTILFPEGGGQPCDFGTINGINVFDVKRKGDQALHFTKVPFKVGENVTVELDWSRRFDHMQQHSGQHLITAVAEELYKYSTTCWNLGADVSFIELNTPSLKEEDKQNLEDDLNDKIRECIPISVHLYEKGSSNLAQVHTRLELPDDHVGPIRVINIKNIDNNTCCGTHVKNTSELQGIKLLYSMKGKKNKTHLFFVVGNRVFSCLNRCFLQEKALCTLLGSSSKELYSSVQKLQKSLKMTNKNVVCALRDIASLEAKLFHQLDPLPKFYSLHRLNAESDFISVFLNEVGDNEVLFFLTVSDGKSVGHVTLSGPEELVKRYEPQVSVLLDCKGTVKNGKFQGKFTKCEKIPEAETLLRKSIEE